MPSLLTVETTCSSETLYLSQTPRRYIPEGHRIGNFTVHALHQIFLGR
jgi:hypothetical protein